MSDFDLTNEASADKISQTILMEGVVRIQNFLTDIDGIKEEVMNIVNESVDDGSYEFGKAVRIGNYQQQFRPDRKNIYSFFSSLWMKQVVSKYFGKADFNKDIFITHDFRNDKGLARNGFLHFDRLHAFKFMLYLTDCDSSNGAFGCIPGSHLIGHRLRTSSWHNQKNYDVVKNRILLDFPELGYSENDVVSMDGKAGTLLIFDTDTFHLGGVLKEQGKERLIIRSHSWKME